MPGERHDQVAVGADGIARVAVELQMAGIANGRVTGNGHTWNAVKIDGKWCQMDLTWDDTKDNWYGDLDQRHLYFGLTDELTAIAHSDHTKNYQAEGYAYCSTDLANNYFVRNGKADEWAGAYADRIQQHLNAKETEFSIEADNQSFPPSISGIQNAIITYEMNQREWNTADGSVTLAATSNATTVSNYEWSTKFDFDVEYPKTPKQRTNISQTAIRIACAIYAGEPLEPTVSVAYNGISLVRGTGYTVTYTDNVTPGTATAAIVGINSYTGSVTKTIEIVSGDDTSQFNSGLYENNLGRRADAEGFAAWLENAENNMPYAEIAACFFASDEFQAKRYSNQEIVEIAYRSLLLRQPDAIGKAAWTNFLDNEASLDDIVKSIADSAEFHRLFPNPAIGQYIDNLYENALGRPADDEGRAAWCNALYDGTTTTGEVAVAFFSSTEFSNRNLRPKETVIAIYRAILNREPDNEGFSAWLENANNGLTCTEMARCFALSDEFAAMCATKRLPV